MAKRNLTRSAVWLAVLLIASKVLGLAQEILMAGRFGTSSVTDAYAVAVTLPTVLFTLFSKGFSESYIPIHTRLPQEKRDRLFSNTLTLLGLLSALVAAAAALGAGIIAGMLAPGFQGEAAELTAAFCRVIVLQFPLLVFFALFSARLQAQEDFIAVSIVDSLLVHFILIASVLLASAEHPMPLAYGYVLSTGAAGAALAVYARRKYRLRWHWMADPRDADFCALCSLALPLGLSLLVDELNSMVDRMFSSGLGTGVTSALSYANRVQGLVMTLTTMLFIQVCYPRMNLYFAAGEKEKGSGYVQKALLIACYTSIPLVVMFALYAQPIIRIIFQRGAFSDESTAVTAVCLTLYALGIPFFSFRRILTNALAANMRQKLILRNTVITVASNIALDFLLVRILGYRGLALATSLSGALAAGLMYRDVRALQLPVFTRRQAADVVKYTLATACAAAVSLPVYHALLTAWSDELSALAAIAAAGIVYVLVTVLLKSELLIWLHAHLPARLQVLRGYFPVPGENPRK